VEIDGRPTLNFCANNYLGLANHPAIVAAAHDALDRWGFGMASVRMICGTQMLHVELERALSAFLHTEASILYSSCFDANAGVFEALLDERDVVISDELNHASIIDGIRLCKAGRHRYANRDMASLQSVLEATPQARRRLIVTDGVFSMDGSIAPLEEICTLAKRYDAAVMVDESHATGVIGATGAGTPELTGTQQQVDIVSGTFGKALGGASGGYISGRKTVVDLLRQRSRPYIFSNAVAPPVVAGSIAALALVSGDASPRQALAANAVLFRRRMTAVGFTVMPGSHPIVPVMFEEDAMAGAMAGCMLHEGVLVAAFAYPIVPRGLSRIRVQISALHSAADIEFCVAAFRSCRQQLSPAAVSA
jgi:glycine C-acetyltransferase